MMRRVQRVVVKLAAATIANRDAPHKRIKHRIDRDGSKQHHCAQVKTLRMNRSPQSQHGQRSIGLEVASGTQSSLEWHPGLAGKLQRDDLANKNEHTSHVENAGGALR